jgi:DNA-binding Lrp family transcriptional regulator
MDALDERIIAILRKDGRTPFVKIGKHLGMTEGAVRARVKKLTKERVIERFTVEVKDSTRAVVLVATAQAIPTSKISQMIKEIGADRVYEVSGNYDIICFVQAKSIDELNSTIERIRAIDGVVDTSTSMVLK